MCENRSSTEPRFFSSKHDSNASNQQAFLILIAAEIPIAHVLLHLYSPTVALVVSALSLYGLMFLYAEYRATLLRPTTIAKHSAQLRSGILGDVELPFSAIAAVEPVRSKPARRKSELRYIGTGTANVVLSLKPDTQLHTLFGKRRIEAIYLGLDEPQAFIEQVRQKIDS